MLALNIVNTKEFMQYLFKDIIFDNLETREIKINTFVNFEINGTINKDFFNQEEIEKKYCLWSEIKPYVFNIIKGKKLPKYIKIILSVREKNIPIISNNASSLFLNITFENNKILCITGSSQKTFSLDKSYQYNWDEYITNFFKKFNIKYINNL